MGRSESLRREPVLERRREVRELVEPSQLLVHQPVVDRAVLVDQEVAKARDATEPLLELRLEDAVLEQPRDDVTVLAQALRKVPAQDVRARVEAGLVRPGFVRSGEAART